MAVPWSVWETCGERHFHLSFQGEYGVLRLTAVPIETVDSLVGHNRWNKRGSELEVSDEG